MTTLYLDCRTGAAGDMMTSALLDLVPDRATSLARLNAIGLAGVSVTATETRRGGLRGTAVTVSVNGEVEGRRHHEHGEHHHEHEGHHHEHGDHHHHHHHASMAEISAIIDALLISNGAKAHVKAVYELIAAAEAKAHGVPVTEVHFHEVGAMDAICDIAAVTTLIEELSPDRVLAATPEVGGGFVRCAHGLLPVPAPATANLLTGIPFTSGAADCELLTPTGAALLRHFASGFGPMPPMAVRRIGTGCGTRELTDRPNVLRAFWGEDAAGTGGPNGCVTELKANIDDMTGEQLAFACEQLRAAGALDVAVAPILMKKGRPAHLLTVLVTPEQADALATEMLRVTSTFGVRRAELTRYELDRHVEPGPDGVRVKTGTGYGVTKSKPEFDDIRNSIA